MATEDERALTPLARSRPESGPHSVHHPHVSGADPNYSVLAINPIRLSGPWSEGFALDVHTTGSQYLGDDEYGHPRYETTRSPTGELLYELKYHSDKSVAPNLCEAAADFVRSRRWEPNLVIPTPPSRPGRRFQPVPLLADGIARLLGCSCCEDCVVKFKETPELKSIHDYQQRLEHLRDAYAVATEKTQNHDILLVDDLYRSGATLEAVTNALRSKGNVRKVFALTFTRTRSNR